MEDHESSPEPTGPLPIRRLEESVINRIAAGEVQNLLNWRGQPLDFPTDYTKASSCIEGAY